MSSLSGNGRGTRPVALPPASARDVIEALAEVELAVARSLSVALPGQPSFDEKVAIGLDIGRAGRRLGFLVASIDEMDSPAPSVSLEAVEGGARSLPLAAVYAAAGHRLGSGLATHRPRVGLGHAGADILERDRLRPDPSFASPDDSPDDSPGDSLIGALSRSRDDRRVSRPRRARRGPFVSVDDPRWRRARGDEALPRMLRLERDSGLRHKLHHTAYRELMAAQVAGLNLLEYDGLPWRFYYDMSQQVEDEVRHAAMALEGLERLGASPGDFLLPVFGDYHSLFADMDLVERLVCMNLDTEGPGASYLQMASERMRAIGNDWGASLFEAIHDDERRHARSGGRWLRHLLPDPAARRAGIEAARALAIVHLATVSAERESSAIGDVLARWSSGDGPLRFDGPHRSHHHEVEVSLRPVLAGD